MFVKKPSPLLLDLLVRTDEEGSETEVLTVGETVLFSKLVRLLDTSKVALNVPPLYRIQQPGVATKEIPLFVATPSTIVLIVAVSEEVDGIVTPANNAEAIHLHRVREILPTTTVADHEIVLMPLYAGATGCISIKKLRVHFTVEAPVEKLDLESRLVSQA